MLKKRQINKKEEIVEETDTVLPFQVIQGGLAKTGSKEPPSFDWLSELTPNTVFLAAPKQGFEPICGMFQVIGHSEHAVNLRQETAEFWVIPDRFCVKMRLVDVLEIGHE